MIEYRAMLTVDMRFEGGLELSRGTIVYAWETPSGWIGSYWPDPTKTGSHSFALEPEQFSIFTSGDGRVQDIVIVPLPPERTASEEELERQTLERRRILARIRALREEADNLDRALAQEKL